MARQQQFKLKLVEEKGGEEKLNTPEGVGLVGPTMGHRQPWVF